MSELMISIQIDDEGHTIAVPFIQIAGIGRAIKEIEQCGLQAVWHPAACGCCFIVHARPDPGELMRAGFVVGPDGRATFHDYAEEEH